MTALDLIEVPTGVAARAVFTTRAGGVSEGSYAGLNLGADTGDRAEAVRANRALLSRELGLDPGRVSMVRQVHGTAVRVLEAPSRPGLFTGDLRGWPEGDGLATRTPGIGLAVLGADCLPVLLWRRDAPGVAAAHAGWRGLVDGVLGAAVAALGEPGRLGAAIGPGVGPCCYPVSAEVRERFAAAFGDGVVRGRAVDLAASAHGALVRAGVPASAVHVVEACTSCQADRLYSYRRDGARCGRQAGVIWATPDGEAS